MLDTPPKIRRSRLRSAALVFATTAFALPMFPRGAAAQTAQGQQGWSSAVVTWNNANPPPGVILPGSVSTPQASTVIPVVTTPGGSGAPNATSPAAPLSVNGTIVRVTAASVAPDSLAVAARVALGALKDRGPAIAPASSPGAPGVVVPSVLPSMVDSGQGWHSMIVSTDAIEKAVAKAAPVSVTDPQSQYAIARSQVAAVVAARAKVDPVALDQAWARTDDRRMTALFAALAQVGTLYKYAGNTPGGFDCSGLTSYAWSVAGVKIPRTSGDQINATAARQQHELQPGDLLWRPGHIGLYVGLGELMVHSPRSGKPVTVEGWGKRSRMGSPI